MSNTATRRPMPSDSKATASLIFSATGFLTGETVAELNYQPHTKKLCAGCYAIHIPSGKAGRVTGTAIEEREEMGRMKYTKVFGVAWDSEYPSSVLRRITPKQYSSLPEECKITSYETGIY